MLKDKDFGEEFVEEDIDEVDEEVEDEDLSVEDNKDVPPLKDENAPVKEDDEIEDEEAV